MVVAGEALFALFMTTVASGIANHLLRTVRPPASEYNPPAGNANLGAMMAISFSKEASYCSIIRLRSKSRSIPRKHCGYSLAAPTLKVAMSGFLPNVLREKSMT